MIDTVVFRIYDLELHESLCSFLNKKTTSTGVTITQHDPDTGEYPESIKRIHRTYLHYHDTGKMIEKAHFNQLASSHYNISYQIDYQRNFITFNLSIPKYLFGTNVLLYNLPPTAKRFSYSEYSTIEKNLKESFRLLHKFFDRFFATESGTLRVHRQFVKIERVDLCYNQLFLSKQDALGYIQQLKKIKKKYSREASNYSRSWETSLAYVTDRYSFKVYHKGTEFKKNDRKKLAALPGNKFDVDYYQDLADRTLRYEMTIRNSYFSYLYMNHLFRKDCPIWRYSTKKYNEYRKEKEKDNFLTYRKTLTQDDKKHIDYVKSILFKTKSFFLECDNGGYDEDTDHEVFDSWPQKKEHFVFDSPFTKELFTLAADKFLTILEEFKLVTFQDSVSILSKLDRINTDAETKKRLIETLGIGDKLEQSQKPKVMRRSRMVFLLELLEKYTFEEIEKGQMFPRQTWYRYKKELALLGITDKSLLGLTVNADFTLQKYNTEVLYNLSKFPYLGLVQ